MLLLDTFFPWLVMPWTIESPLSISIALPVSMDVQSLSPSSGWREDYTSSSGTSLGFRTVEEPVPGVRGEPGNNTAYILSSGKAPRSEEVQRGN